MEVGRLLSQSRLWHGVLETVPRHAREGWGYTVDGQSAQQSSWPLGKPFDQSSLSFCLPLAPSLPQVLLARDKYFIQ